MKNLKTITEKEILNAAWTYYLEQWCNAVEDAESSEKILGRKSEILERKVLKYKLIEEELHNELLKL